MGGFWDFGARVGGVLAAALSPLWRAWDWLTGRRTVHLAWILFTICSAWDMVQDVSQRNYLDIGIGALTTVIIGSFFMAVTATPSADQNSDAISAEAFVCRMTLAAMAGITGILWAVSLTTGVSLLLLTGKPLSVSHAIGALYILAELAGAVDHASGGKSCLRRAADRIAESLPSLSPAGVQA